MYDPYYAGLVDSDGSIVFNYAGNRIECNLKFKYNEYTSKLNFDNTILNCRPTILKRKNLLSLVALKISHLSHLNFKTLITCYLYMIILCIIDISQI